MWYHYSVSMYGYVSIKRLKYLKRHGDSKKLVFYDNGNKKEHTVLSDRGLNTHLKSSPISLLVSGYGEEWKLKIYVLTQRQILYFSFKLDFIYFQTP